MALELTILRTRVARRILGLFILSAVLPIVILGVFSYRRVASQLTDQAAGRLRQLSKAAGMALLKRLEIVDADARARGVRLSTVPDSHRGPVGPEREPQLIAGLALEGPGRVWRSLYGDTRNPPPIPSTLQESLRSGQSVLLVQEPTRVWLVHALADPSQGLVWAQVAAPGLWSIDETDEVLPRETSLCILDNQRAPLYCPAGVPAMLAGAANDLEGGRQVVTWKRHGTDMLVGSWPLFLRSRFNAPELIVAVSEPTASILAPAARFRQTFPLAVLLTLALALFLGYRLIRRNTEPLAQLQDGTKRLAALDFSQPVRVTSGDEFEDLAAAFNGMAWQLQQASQSLRDSETRLRTILETAAEGIITTDATGRIEAVNRTGERMFGYARQELFGRSVGDLLHDGPERLRFWRPGASPQLSGQRRDGSAFPIELSVSEATLGGRSVLTGFVRDVSERKRADEERGRLEAQLRQSQKLETIGTLAGGIAHDFNNILTAVLGYLDLALPQIPKGSTAYADLEEVRQAALRATDLARQILVFSRRAEQQRRLVMLDEVVNEALKLLRASLPATIEIRSKIEPAAARVLADATQIHQVVMNLCINAYHAMRERGGVLDIRLSTVEVDRDRPGIQASVPVGRYSCLTVRDTGHGMDRSTIDRIFEPFFTTKPAGEGTGLGLSVVHGIVTSHGGAITVESAPGIGTTFTVYLPAATGEREDETATAVVDLAGHERVLVVDDDAAIAEVTRRLLERGGYRVTARTSSLEALELLRADPNHFDLLLTDQTMPGLTGIELAEAAQQVRPGLPVILSSGLSEAPAPERRRAVGIHALLVKPASIPDFAKAIRQALGDRTKAGEC